MAHRTLLILPDDTGKQIVDLINNAKKSLRIKMFIFTDPELMNAVIAAKKRGVEVKVMLNPARRNGVEENDETRKTFAAAGIDVHDSNPTFGITHEKSMVVDDEVAVVHSLNWDTKNLTESRDYAIITSHKHEVAEIAAVFDADWNRKDYDTAHDSKLIWCKGNGRTRFAELIDAAKETLFVQNERYQDSVIIEHLVRAAVRGVKVHIMAKKPHSLKPEKMIEGVGGLRILNDVGIKIHKLKNLKLHGKMIIADGTTAIIGSINYAPGSFDDRRELSIETHDKDIIDRLQKTAQHDWENSHPIDLTDAGLLKDLEGHNVGSSEGLALEVDDKAVKHHKHNDK